MAGLWALRWSLLVLGVADTEVAPRQKLQVRYLPHGIQLVSAPSPARRNLEFVHRIPPKRPEDSFANMPRAGNVQLFGDPLPGDNFSLTTNLPWMAPSRPGLMQKQARAGGLGPFQMPNVYDLPQLDERLVTRLGLGPPPPSVDLSHLAELSGLGAGSLRTGQPAHGFPPPGLNWQGQGFGPPRVRGNYGSRKPWYSYDLTMPTAMGPYDRRLKLRPVSAPQTSLQDTDDPGNSTTKVTMPYDSWLGAQEGGEAGIVTPPDAEQLAPLAPPRMSAGNDRRLHQGGKVDEQDYPIMKMLKNFPRFHALLEEHDREETSTRWQYRYSRVPATSTPPPALLSKEGGMMDDPGLESSEASSFSDAEPPVNPRPRVLSNSSKIFDYLLL